MQRFQTFGAAFDALCDLINQDSPELDGGAQLLLSARRENGYETQPDTHPFVVECPASMIRSWERLIVSYEPGQGLRIRNAKNLHTLNYL